jgi:hypothetical protein
LNQSQLNFDSTHLQLFLEEERERELEAIYESGIADSLNRVDAPVGNGEESEAQAEMAAITKQTTETLMAGEKIMEALDLADAERAAMKEYEEHKSMLPGADAIILQPPPQNPILAAYGLEPEEYVLRVVQRVQSTALHDALLVLPFGKVVSLMGYLNIWAQNVRLLIKFSVGDSNIGAGMEYNFGFSYHLFPPENTSPPGSGQPHYARGPHSSAKAPPGRPPATKNYYRI